MLKRSGAILLTMLYVVTVLGFALNLHYCGTEITSVKIDSPAVSCKMDQDGGKMKCCHDKQLEVKIKDAHETESPSFLSKIFGFELPKMSFDTIFHFAPESLSDKFYDGDPPDTPLQGVAVFIKNCIFRI